MGGYLSQSGIPSTSSRGYNASGRAFPDIAAQAASFCVIPGGCYIWGTSCSTPTVSGIIGLLNDLRAVNGQSSLGFLNPWIYQHSGAFNDITSGSSEGCSS